MCAVTIFPLPIFFFFFWHLLSFSRLAVSLGRLLSFKVLSITHEMVEIRKYNFLMIPWNITRKFLYCNKACTTFFPVMCQMTLIFNIKNVFNHSYRKNCYLHSTCIFGLVFSLGNMRVKWTSVEQNLKWIFLISYTVIFSLSINSITH